MNYEHEMECAYNLVKSAGTRLMDFFKKEDLAVEQKSTNNPVTEADYAANAILVQGLMRHFPRDAILSEESCESFSKRDMDIRRKTSSRVWILDPLDGTKEFIAGLPHFAVSVALWHNGRAVLGFIYNPARDFFLYGGSSCGIFLNRKPFVYNRAQPLSLTEMCFCFSRSEINKGLLEHLISRLPNIKKTVLGSIAYKLALLASGQCDLVLSLKPKNEWDFAAGMALLEAVGHKILDLNFEDIALNKEDPLSANLICGSQQSIQLYRDFLHNL